MAPFGKHYYNRQQTVFTGKNFIPCLQNSSTFYVTAIHFQVKFKLHTVHNNYNYKTVLD